MQGALFNGDQSKNKIEPMLAPWSLTAKLQKLIHKTKKMEQTVLKCMEANPAIWF
jgi:hypothetical protein